MKKKKKMPLPMLPPRFTVSLIVFSLLVVTTSSHLSSGPHIADVNILLPPKMTHPVEYRLQGSDGCFKWSWDHHDILSVVPEYNISSHCSTSARLRSISPFNGRKETAVYAADVQTGIVIRCKVFIDNISRIQIFHNSVKLDLDGLATVRVRAFDAEDNVFSSLVGLQFMWELVPETDGLDHHLVHVPLKDSPLSDCGGLCGDLDIQIKLEDSGVFSDLYVVKGVEIGHENVTVNLLEPRFKHLSDKIVLTVAEAMSLEPPSPVFILIGATLRYTLKVIRGNVPQVVSLPSPHHRWSSLNSSVAEVDPSMGFARALSLGITEVMVEDVRVAGHVQASSLYVVLPDNFCLYLMPLSTSADPLEGLNTIPSVARWYVVKGRQYLVEMKVFSQGPVAQEIYITESDDLKLHDNQSKYWTTSLPSEGVVVKHGWQNSRILRATLQGLGKLMASLTYFNGYQETKEVLKVVQEIMVCEQVKFSLDGATGTSQTIFLPWVPAAYQEVELKATGGCGKVSTDYKWFSSDMGTLSVIASGVVQAKKPGKATIKVVSIYDPFNYDEVVIEVSIPSAMVMLQNFPVETVVGSHLQAAVTMKASNGAYFYKCDALHSMVRWKAGSESFIVVNTTEEQFVVQKIGNASFGPPCSWTHFYASGSGQTMLHATLSKEYPQVDHSVQEHIVLRVSMRIAAYPPLVVRQAGDGNQFGGYWFDLSQSEAGNLLKNLEELYLVPGTSLEIMLLGGPEKWDEDIDFIETVELVDDNHGQSKSGVLVHQIPGNCHSLYRVSCEALGTFRLVFKRGNLVGDDHPRPVVAEVTLPLTCSFPSAIVLLADEPVNRHDIIRSAVLADRSAGQIHVTPVTVANGQTIRLAAVAISNSGEPFANSSLLALRWELSSCEGLASWDDAFAKMQKSSWERFLALQNESGQCIVRVTVIGDTVAYPHAASLQSSEDILTDAIRLQIVSTLRVDPEFNLLIFNPNAKVNLSIIGGSCFLEAVVNDTQVIEVIQPPLRLQCLQLTLAPKGLGTALVTVYDIGLTPPVAASALAQVADVDWIKIVSGEEISIMEGQTRSIDLVAGINDGRTFDPYQYAHMGIRLHIEDPIVELLGDNQILTPAGLYVKAPKFQIIAKHLGVTTLYVSAKQKSGHEILSQPVKIEVYAPLSVHPHDIFLAPGASYLLSVDGGPTMGINIEYASLDDGIATVDRHSGQVSAISPGNTTILSTVYRKGDLICQAYGNVKVGVPSSAILNVQSEKLAVGNKMPIYPAFPEGNLFSFYKLCKRYTWTVDEEEVLSFNMAVSLSGENHWVPLDDENDLGFLQVLFGRSAGSANIAVTFSCDFISTSYSQSRLYDASISVMVLPDLPLALGVPITWVLPPYYITSSLLPSALESHGQWDSQSHKGTISHSLLRSCADKSEGLQKDEISIDGDRIKTKESNNLACIQAKDRITGRTEIASCVKVAEVAQIRIANKDFPFRIIRLAVGDEIDLPIDYFDALGNPFFEAHNVTSYAAETNYHDVVFLGNTKNGSGIHMKAMRHGEALVRVSMNWNPQKSDYLLVSVGAHLYPQNPSINQGSALKFRVEGITDHASGHWHSANDSVICIDASGKAEGVGVGSTQVFFESSNMKLQTTVTVLSESIISVHAPKEMLTNVPWPTKGYRFSVEFRDTHTKLQVVGNGKGVSYDCRVDPPFVGHTTPWMDLDTRSFYCLFFPYSPEELARSIPRSKDMKPYTTVSVNASLREAKHVSGSASTLFIGGFSVLGMDQSSMQLNLTSDSNKTIITILGNTDVDIHWHERNSLTVSPIHKEDLGIGGRAEYQVKVQSNKKLKDKIIISLPANGQRVEIDVNYEPCTRAVSKLVKFAEFLHAREFVIAVVGGFLLFILLRLAIPVAYMELTNTRPPQSATPLAPATTHLTPPRHIPERSSPIVTEQSPRTPQPLIEYARRTIDETPYYRRDSRRRFNPQNTF